jgi:hypothetical protein
MVNNSLKEFVNQLHLFDTHEHIVPESFRNQQELDFTYFLPHYLNSDLVASGMPTDEIEAIRGPGRIFIDYLKNSIEMGDRSYPFEERIANIHLTPLQKWERLSPYWENCQNTGFAKCIQIAVRDLFKIEDINGDTHELLTKKLNESKRAGWYDEVLKDKTKIDLCIVDVGAIDFEQPYFHPSLRFDKFIHVKDRVALQRIEHENQRSIYNVKDLVETLKSTIEKYKKEGLIAIKTGLAYERPLCFENESLAEAEALFNRLFTHPNASLSWQDSTLFQDYMMHQLIRASIDFDLPIQIHTGFQSGNDCTIHNSDPTLLINLFRKYREARFDIFHASYPFQSELAILAKNFPNVYANLCWMPIISPWIAEQILHEWLEVVPVNKIFAFGGDFTIVEGVYGHAKMTRDIVTRVLTHKVEYNYFSMEKAMKYATMLFHDNAREFYKTG